MFPNKWLIIVPVILGILYVTWFGVLGWPRPFKTTDVTSPHFDPHQFRIEDYLYRRTLSKNLPLILKVGMTEEEVDKILVHSAQAKKKGRTNAPTVIAYCRIPDFAWMRALWYMSDVQGYHVYVELDDDGKLTKISRRVFPSDHCR